MSALSEYRASRGLTLEQMAVELELSAKSRGWLSEIERGVTDASLRLALRIERWSGGQVSAGSVCKELAEHSSAPVSDPDRLDGHASAGAENPRENVSRTEGAAA